MDSFQLLLCFFLFIGLFSFLISPPKLLSYSLTLILIDPTRNSSLSSVRKNGNKTVVSSANPKPNWKSIVSSAAVEKPKEKTALLSTNSMKPNAATALSSAHGEQVMFFWDVSHEAVMRLIKKTLVMHQSLHQF